MTSLGTPNVLVVEDRAHWRGGHYPSRFAELASGLAAEGCRVEALTARGWSLEDDAPRAFPVRRYGPIAKQLARVSDRLERNAVPSGLQPLLRGISEWLRVTAMVGAARARVRRLPECSLVVIVSDRDRPDLAAALAGPGRWLAYTFGPPRWASTAVAARRDRAVSRAAARSERRRRESGGRYVVAAVEASLRAQWAGRLPYLEVVTARLAGSGERPAIANARRELGFERSNRVALLFGHEHAEKDVGVVLRAFSDLSDNSEWRLVLAGRVADRADIPAHMTKLGGFVDDHTRALVYSAADLVVISFRPGHLRNSGTLMDAVTWGVPVVCSDRCAAADLVHRYRLGVTFEAGNARSLADAVGAAPSRIEADDLANARADLSNRAVARQVLTSVGLDSTYTGESS